MTAFTTSSKTLLDNYIDRRFVHSEEALQTALQCEGLKAAFTPFKFDKKPLLYPDFPTHVVIRSEAEDATEKAKKARQLWHDAETVSAITKADDGITPRDPSEIIASIVNGSYDVRSDEQGVLAFSGLRALSASWYELGPVFVRPDARSSGLGSEIVHRKLSGVKEGENVIAFTNDGAAANIFTREGFSQENMRRLPLAVMQAILADRIRTPLRIGATARVAFTGGKNLYIRS